MTENTATLAVTAGAASVARGAVAAGLRYRHLFSSLGSHIGCSESQTLDVLKVNTKRLVLIQLCKNQVCTTENTFDRLVESVTLNSQ